MLLLLLTTYIPQGNVEQNQLTAKMERNKRNNTGREKNNISKYYPTKLRLLSNHNDFYCLFLRENITIPRKCFHKFSFLMWVSGDSTKHIQKRRKANKIASLQTRLIKIFTYLYMWMFHSISRQVKGPLLKCCILNPNAYCPGMVRTLNFLMELKSLIQVTQSFT